MTYYNVTTADDYVSVEGDSFSIMDNLGVAIMREERMVAYFGPGAFVSIVEHDDEADAEAEVEVDSERKVLTLLRPRKQ